MMTHFVQFPLMLSLLIKNMYKLCMKLLNITNLQFCIVFTQICKDPHLFLHMILKVHG